MRFRKTGCGKLFLLILLSLLLYLGLITKEAANDPSGEMSVQGGGRRMAAEESLGPWLKGEGPPSPPASPAPGEDSLAGARQHGLPNVSREEEKEEVVKGPITIEQIQQNIERENKAQTVKNLDLFGPVTNETVVILVQVHNRASYLRQLITSLSKAKGVEKTLIVFSHDVWDEEINTLVRCIDFAPLVQLHYPFSLQTHPHSFPGESPSDCPRDAKPHRAKSLNCANSKWPDIHGHYREAKFTQTKHHWWWKANRVFNGLEITKHFTGSVVFLEEDHYISADFLHVLGLMNIERTRLGDQGPDIISMGTYLKRTAKISSRQDPRYRRRDPRDHRRDPRDHLRDPRDHKYFLDPRDSRDSRGRPPVRSHRSRNILSNPHRSSNHLQPSNPQPSSPQSSRPQSSRPQSSNSSSFSSRRLLWESPVSVVLSLFNQVEVTDWLSSKHNMGMVFTRQQWDKVLGCSNQFCQYDDYNWDWSLQHISFHCIKDKFKVMMVKGPRVFHIGECGVHHKKTDCDSSAALKKVTSIIQSSAAYFFPERLTLVKAMVRKKPVKLKKGNGGWGDARDHQLCLNMTIPRSWS